jgi:hypothetical protein
VRNSGYTIPDSDTYLYYLVNNGIGTTSACGAAAALNLPHSTAVGAGRIVIASPANVPLPTTVICTQLVTVAVQSGDTLRSQGGASSLTAAHPITAVSDGAGHWIVMNSDGR